MKDFCGEISQNGEDEDHFRDDYDLHEWCDRLARYSEHKRALYDNGVIMTPLKHAELIQKYRV